jgi:hypothetical protein
MDENPLVGKTIAAIYLASDNKALRFDVAEGDSMIVRVDGDCCSSTWIESIDGAELLIGSKIVAVEDIEMPMLEYDSEKYDYLQFYGCKIRSEKGEMLIDYRNESNGYYGGNLSWPDDSYFYGGVFGQNDSNNDFKKIA